MPTIAAASATPASRVGSFGATLLKLGRRIAVGMAVRAERRALMTLHGDTLKDLGFNKGQAEAEAARWFWDVPEDRLRE